MNNFSLLSKNGRGFLSPRPLSIKISEGRDAPDPPGDQLLEYTPDIKTRLTNLAPLKDRINISSDSIKSKANISSLNIPFSASSVTTPEKTISKQYETPSAYRKSLSNAREFQEKNPVKWNQFDYPNISEKMMKGTIRKNLYNNADAGSKIRAEGLAGYYIGTSPNNIYKDISATDNTSAHETVHHLQYDEPKVTPKSSGRWIKQKAISRFNESTPHDIRVEELDPYLSDIKRDLITKGIDSNKGIVKALGQDMEMSYPMREEHNSGGAYTVRSILRAKDISEISPYYQKGINKFKWKSPDGTVHKGLEGLKTYMKHRIQGLVQADNTIGDKMASENIYISLYNTIKVAEKRAGIKEDYLKKLIEAEKETNTSPTQAQIEAENYKKGKFRWNGMEISIENPRKSVRSGTSPDGAKWSIKMNNAYGYIKMTESEADGDHIDVFIGDDLDSEIVFIVNQKNKDGKFDEHKCMLGFKNAVSAKKAYLSNYEKNWTGFSSIVPITLVNFKIWIREGESKHAFTGK